MGSSWNHRQLIRPTVRFGERVTTWRTARVIVSLHGRGEAKLRPAPTVTGLTLPEHREILALRDLEILRANLFARATPAFFGIVGVCFLHGNSLLRGMQLG